MERQKVVNETKSKARFLNLFEFVFLNVLLFKVDSKPDLFLIPVTVPHCTKCYQHQTLPVP